MAQRGDMGSQANGTASSPLAAGPPDVNYRPSPSRAASLQTYSFKARAASQPAGERLPIPSSPSTTAPEGRSSPIIGGERFGVIGGSRSTGRFAGALAAGTQTRASSFSGGETRDVRVSSSVDIADGRI